MPAHLLSLNVGSPEPMDLTGQLTGIRKRPVESLEVRAPGPKHGGLGSGAVGDYLGSRQHHGGDGQALYAVAREELDVWGERLDRQLPNGMFGENLTTLGHDVDASVIGERWQLGDDVVVEVTGPRIPCSTFAWRMGVKGWVKRFTERGRTGAYLSVVAPGALRPGARLVVVERPDHGVSVPMVFRAFMGDLELADRILSAHILVADEHAALARPVAARSRATRSSA
jgi:MOSC domain-containing protein YiiM